MAKPKVIKADVTKAGHEHLEIVKVSIDSIHPNNYNPNRQSDHEFELLCRSIEEDGFTQPILVRKGTNEIVDGEHRWRACKALGWEEIDICYVEMTEVQQKIATLRHNRARGTEDIQKAADIIKDLEVSGALDWVADSLIMDPVELNLLTKVIPENELNLRSDGMTYDQTVDIIKTEEQIRLQQEENDKLLSKADTAKYTLQFSFVDDEAKLVHAVIGRKQAQGIKELCEELARQ